MDLKELTVIYITKDIERAIGLEDTLPNYTIITANANPTTVRLLRKKNIRVLNLEKQIKYSYQLLKHPQVKAFITSIPTPYKAIQTFKPTRPFEFFSSKLYPQTTYLNPTYNIAQKFEGKISQLKLFKKIQVKHPQTITMELESIEFKQVRDLLGLPFVLQFNRGHTGNTTFFINNSSELKQIQQSSPSQTVRLLKYIDGDTWTVNAVATKLGTFVGGLSYQITGIPECTSQAGSTVGNDWSRADSLTPEIIDNLIQTTIRIGDTMYKEGFKGLFGIDFILQEKDLFVIEINARQPASVSLFTQLQEEQREVPLKALHIAEFLSKTPGEFKQIIQNYAISSAMQTDRIEDNITYSRRNTTNIQASQLFYRNTESKPVDNTIGIPQGVYSSSLEFLKEAYSIKEIDSNTLLILTQQPPINPNGEIFRVIRRGPYKVLSHKPKIESTAPNNQRR